MINGLHMFTLVLMWMCLKKGVEQISISECLSYEKVIIHRREMRNENESNRDFCDPHMSVDHPCIGKTIIHQKIYTTNRLSRLNRNWIQV